MRVAPGKHRSCSGKRTWSLGPPEVRVEAEAMKLALSGPRRLPRIMGEYEEEVVADIQRQPRHHDAPGHCK